MNRCVLVPFFPDLTGILLKRPFRNQTSCTRWCRSCFICSAALLLSQTQCCPQLRARLLKLRLLRWWAASGFTPQLMLPKCSAPLQNKKENKNPSPSCENNTYFYLRSSISACVWRTVTTLRRLFCVPDPTAHISCHRHGSPGINRLSLSIQPSQIYH